MRANEAFLDARDRVWEEGGVWMPVWPRRERLSASSPTALPAMWSLRLAGFRFRVLSELVEKRLNVAEAELNVIICQCLNRAWRAARDRIRAKIDWQFTTDDARAS